jgi:hypothetical protein
MPVKSQTFRDFIQTQRRFWDALQIKMTLVGLLLTAVLVFFTYGCATTDPSVEDILHEEIRDPACMRQPPEDFCPPGHMEYVEWFGKCVQRLGCIPRRQF